MKLNKKLTLVTSVVTILLVVTGCSPSQQEMFNAAIKMQDVKSMQQHTTMTFQLTGSGFDPNVQQQVNTAAMFLNNAKLDLDVKTSGNEQKTAVKAEENINLALQGMDIKVPIWVDSDLTGKTPKVTEIIKIPQIAKASLPPQFANKDYMVMDPMNMSNSGLGAMDMTKLTEFSKKFQATELKFLTSYSQRFNPTINAYGNSSEYMQTDDGLKMVSSYQISINDAQFKELIRYSVNNFVQDKEAMNFVKEFMDSIIGMSQTPDKAKSLSDFDQAFKAFDVNQQVAFLAKFNTVMDQLKNVTLLGDRGLKLDYAVYNGYFIKESTAIDLKMDMAQINQFMNTVNGKPTASVDAKGTVDMMINCSTNISKINTPLEIQIPELNKINSFNYLDLMNLITKPNKKSRIGLVNE